MIVKIKRQLFARSEVCPPSPDARPRCAPRMALAHLPLNTACQGDRLPPHRAMDLEYVGRIGRYARRHDTLTLEQPPSTAAPSTSGPTRPSRSSRPLSSPMCPSALAASLRGRTGLCADPMTCELSGLSRNRLGQQRSDTNALAKSGYTTTTPARRLRPSRRTPTTSAPSSSTPHSPSSSPPAMT